MAGQPIADAREGRELARIGDKYGARKIVLEYVRHGEKSYWRAIVLPTDETIAHRLGIDWIDLTEAQVAQWEDAPIAQGDGATRTEALAAIRPVKWS